MHLKTSLKQLWSESKANPAFTALYIGGVTFAVTFTLLYAMLFYTQIAPVYPEYNRDATLTISSLECRNESRMTTKQRQVSPLFAKDHLSQLKNCDFFTITDMNIPVYVQRTDGRPDLRMVFAEIDPNFFRIYNYDFVAGEPFTPADFESDIPVAIITDGVAKTLFGNPEDAVGRDISIQYVRHRIRGVVREGSSINSSSFSQIFSPIPPNEYAGYDDANMTDYLGSYTITMKAADPDRIDDLKEEINDIVRRINASDKDGWQMRIMTMASNFERAFGYSGDNSESFFDKLRPLLLILLVLLIIPAINISGMIGGQMNRRMTEIGLRRSFGAKRRSLCGQVMFENLVLTLVGGAVGLILAWIILTLFENQIFGLLSGSELAAVRQIAPPRVTADMLFAPAVFIGTLIICLILNIISAYIPVRLALRRPIVSSLNQKR